MGSNISSSASKYGNLNLRYIYTLIQHFNLGEALAAQNLGIENTPSHALKQLLLVKLRVDYSQLKIRSYKAKTDLKGLIATRLNRQDPINFITSSSSSSSSFSCNNSSSRSNNNSIIMQIIETMLRGIIQMLNSQSTPQLKISSLQIMQHNKEESLQKNQNY